MRKVILFNLITLDGYFEGTHKWDIDWHRVDEEFDEFSIDQLNHAGGIIFGRVTYEGMASFWSSPKAIETDPVVAAKMNSLPKFVFSRTKEKADWNNSQIIKGDAVQELKKLKEQPGNDLFIFGSADLASTFIKHNMIDEYRLLVNPILLGKGGAMFTDNGESINLKLLNIRVFHNGNVLLKYAPDRV
jgi:dihydrofolate reductase